MELTERERNDLFKALTEKGLDRADCELDDSSESLLIRHLLTGSRFRLQESGEVAAVSWHAIGGPDQQMIFDGRRKNWNDIMGHLGEWAAQVRAGQLAAQGKVLRPVWKLSQDDKRLLFITAAGGLAANIGLVLVVGLGLVVLHETNRYQHAINKYFFLVLLAPLILIYPASILVALTPKRWRPRVGVGVVIVLGLVVILPYILWLLVVIGYAAGIR